MALTQRWSSRYTAKDSAPVRKPNNQMTRRQDRKCIFDCQDLIEGLHTQGERWGMVKHRDLRVGGHCKATCCRDHMSIIKKYALNSLHKSSYLISPTTLGSQNVVFIPFY